MLKNIAAMGLCLLATSYVAPTAGAADGGGSCSGKLVDYMPLNSVNGTKIGQLELYYSSSGYNCAIFYHGGPSWGKASRTSISLSRKDNGQYRQVASNSGNFKYQAGPIRTYAPSPKCVQAYGGMTYGGRNYSFGTEPHC